MRYKILIFLGVLLLPVAFIANRSNAEDVEELNLRSAVELALQNNLNLQLRQDDVDSAEGATQAAEGAFDIFLDADAGFQSREQTPIFIAGPEQEDTGQWNAEASKLFTTGTSVSLGWNNSSFNSDARGLLLDPSYDSGLTLGLRQPLMKGFGEEVQTALLRSSQKQLEAASYQVDNEAANLAADVKIAYWNLVFAIQDIEVKRLSVTLAQQLLEETEAKISAGRLAEVEIYQPQSQVARREEELIGSERAIGTAEDELKFLLNSDSWPTTIEPTDQPASEAITVDLKTVQNNALKSRPDIKAADLLIEAARYEELRARDNIRPDLALIGGVGLTGTDEKYGDSLDNSISNPDNLWEVGVTFSIPLQNRSAKGNYRQAKASYNRAKTSAELLRQQIRRTVRTTVRDVRLAIKAIDATRKTSLASLKALEAEQAKFDSGRSTTLDVLIAQQSYSQALSQQNLTLITYASILAELDRIQGLVTFSSAR